jgi:hypothetical protein
MLTYTEVRKLAIQLPLVERARLLEDLAASLVQTISMDWDVQLAADIQEGKLDALADKVLADFAAGRCTPL